MRSAIAACIITLLLAGCGGLGGVTGSFTSIDDSRLSVPSGCSDSDGGLEQDVAGKVSFNEGTVAISKDDACVGGLLVEWYCSDDAPASKNIRCADTCKSGACVTK